MSKHLLTTTFLACLPDIQSAIKIGSDGMRIQLDVPEKEKPKAIPVIGMTHKILEITIRELSQEESQIYNLDNALKNNKETTNAVQARSEWKPAGAP